MPASARLLQKLNETWGEEVTQEFVTWVNEGRAVNRAELRELADSYFARFSDLLEQRIAALESRWDGKLEERVALSEARFEAKLTGLEGRLNTSIANLRADVASQMRDQMKWMVALWIGTLVPLASERTPLTTDPALRTIVQRYLDAYPKTLPNRLDFDPRALNTNAPQTIDETRGAASVDHRLSDRSRLAIHYLATHQFVDAFQLVAGQNPDSDVGSQTVRLSLLRGGGGGAWDAGVGFQRARSRIEPEPNAVGAYVRYGFVLEELGPSGEIYREAGKLAEKAKEQIRIMFPKWKVISDAAWGWAPRCWT